MKYNMVSLGPARMDVFVGLPDDEVLEVCSVDKQRCMIELGFGDKIPIKSIQFEIGGNTGNNAVGLARLGYKTAMVGTMGDHWVDQQALTVLKKEGVNVDHVKQTPGAFGFGVIINYQGERTILSYYPDSECDFSINEGDVQTDWVYLTTAGQDYDCFYEDAVEWAKKIGAKIAFNPGSRQVKDGIEKLKYAYAVTEVLFVNKEEAAKLLHKQASEDVKVLLAGLREIGPKTVVVTDGPEGAYTFDGNKYLYMPVVDAPVVERTGAGDAFGSGFLGGLIGEKSIEECLKRGACNSASVLGYVGPQAGLLNEEKMQEWLAKFVDVVAREI